MELPSTDQRVIQRTPDRSNRIIQERIRHSLAYHREHPDEIEQRLQQLDGEWDIERVLQANASSLVLAGGTLGFLAGRKFFAIPIVVSAFLLQHALQGWCPPLPILRRMGYRTAREIQQERSGLEEIRTRH